MAHPKRQAQVEKTLERLGQRAMVIWDDKGDRWDTGRRAMQAYDPDCTHHLVLQDDVLVCNDLIPGVVEMLRYAPIDCPVSLYLGRHRRIPEATAEANAIGASFIEWSKLDHGLGVIVPTADIPAMLAFCDRSDIANYDARLSSYWEAQGRPTWYCQPSLIDHADGESLVPGRKAADHIRSQRVARRFVGEDCSALSVKWTGPVVHVDPPEPPPPPEPTVQAPWRNADMMAAAVSVKAPPHPPRPAPRLQSPCSIASANIRLSAAIMAHPSRSDYVERTLAKLDRATPVVWDEINDRWDTGRRAMLMADSRCTHHVVIQDDLLIPRDLLAGLERTLQHVPRGVPLCGYIGRVRPAADRMRELAAQADQKHASFVTLRQLLWGPLIVVPLEAVVPMITMCDHLDGITNYDLRLSRYWEEMNVRVWYTWPCVVDHADGPSLVPGRTGVDRAKPQPSRVAQRFCGENASVLDLDWSGPVIKGP